MFSGFSQFFKPGTEPFFQLKKDDPRRNGNKQECIYGYEWGLEEDTISPKFEATIYSKKRGRAVKPDLSQELPDINQISRHSLDVLTATLVNPDGCYSLPFQLETKALLSRCCQTGPKSKDLYKKPISQYDEELAQDSEVIRM